MVLKVPRVIKESLDFLVFLEQQEGQDRMVPLALKESLDHQVVDIQDHLGPKVTLVLLDSKGFQGL